MMRKKNLIWMIPVGIVGIAVFVTLGGELVKYLWNWLTPALFGWREITFWQAVGLLALCRILFGGLGCGGHRGNHRGRRLAERWEKMTPEEREKFRQGLHGWARGAPTDATPGA